jgi:hypothetical protein
LKRQADQARNDKNTSVSQPPAGRRGPEHHAGPRSTARLPGLQRSCK